MGGIQSYVLWVSQDPFFSFSLLLINLHLANGEKGSETKQNSYCTLLLTIWRRTAVFSGEGMAIVSCSVAQKHIIKML